MSRPVRFSRDDHVATITLENPPANALSRALVEQLEGILEALAEDDETRAVILTGSGEKAFCAGADLKERKTMSPEEVATLVPRLQALTNLVADVPVPTIAAINGVAFGGGLELALACDIRIASSTASMGLTETSLAIIPGAGGTVRLPRLVGTGRARELIYTARRIDSNEACRIGLVQEIAEPEMLMPVASEMAERIAKNGPLAIRAAKRVLSHESQDADLFAAEQEAYRSIIDSKDRLEGLSAFAEKRPPEYRGE